MTLQAYLAAAQNQRASLLRALCSRMQCNCFLRNYRRVLQQIQRLHQFVSLQGVLAAEAVRVRSLLDFVALKRRGHNTAAGNHFSLVDARSDTRGKPRIDLAEL